MLRSLLRRGSSVWLNRGSRCLARCAGDVRTMSAGDKRDPASPPGSARKKIKPLATAAPPTPAQLAKAARIAQQLQELYPAPAIPLDHASPFQLLVAVMLSAQTTDKKVNEVTPALFKLAPDARSLAALDVARVQAIIRPIGLAPTKAKNLVGMAQLLLERHGGAVPPRFAELESLPGVGHKTASVVLSQAFRQPAFPVDTHIHRLAERWGLSSGKSVEQTEADLKARLPEHTWHHVHLQMIYFGREHCKAQQHQPSDCPMCSWAAGTKAAATTGAAAANGSSSGAGAGSSGGKRKAAKADRAAAATGTAEAGAAAAAAVAASAAASAPARRRRRATS